MTFFLSVLYDVPFVCEVSHGSWRTPWCVRRQRCHRYFCRVRWIEKRYSG